MILFGNLISLIGSVLLVYSGYVKGIKKTLFVQTIQVLFFAISNAILGGINGVVSNIIGLFRNILCYKGKFNIQLKIIFIVLQIVLSLLFNNIGIIGWFPIIAGCLYVIFMDTKKEEVLKVIILITSIFWAIHDFYLTNYIGFIFNVFTIFSCSFALYNLKKNLIKVQMG